MGGNKISGLSPLQGRIKGKDSFGARGEGLGNFHVTSVINYNFDC